MNNRKILMIALVTLAAAPAIAAIATAVVFEVPLWLTAAHVAGIGMALVLVAALLAPTVGRHAPSGASLAPYATR